MNGPMLKVNEWESGSPVTPKGPNDPENKAQTSPVENPSTALRFQFLSLLQNNLVRKPLAYTAVVYQPS